MNTTTRTTSRWDALDVLRGLTIILMLMNLTPGSWEHNYPFLIRPAAGLSPQALDSQALSARPNQSH